MIVWLNGAAGVGKTSVTRELTSMLPKSSVLEPERLGWVRQRTSGLLGGADIQARASWRRRTTRRAVQAERGGHTVLIPLTMLRMTYLEEMLTSMRAQGSRVHHVVLDAPADVLRARIKADHLDPVASPNRERHIAAYERAKQDLMGCGSTFDTNLHTPREIAVAIIDTTSAVGPAEGDSPSATG